MPSPGGNSSTAALAPEFKKGDCVWYFTAGERTAAVVASVSTHPEDGVLYAIELPEGKTRDTVPDRLEPRSSSPPKKADAPWWKQMGDSLEKAWMPVKQGLEQVCAHSQILAPP